MKKRGKRLRDAVGSLDPDKAYLLDEAVESLQLISSVNFDETVELHMRTSADPRHADQLVRGVTMLPHGLGKTVKVLVFANGEAAEIAKQAGADYIGDDEVIKNIQGRLGGFRRRTGHSGDDEQNRAARARSRPPWPDA